MRDSTPLHLHPPPASWNETESEVISIDFQVVGTENFLTFFWADFWADLSEK